MKATLWYTLSHFLRRPQAPWDTLRGKEPKGGQPGVIDLGQLLVLARQAMRKNVSKETSFLTGGEYELFTSNKSFDRFMAEFANHLHNRYLLRFEPKNPRPGLHQVRVRLREHANDVVLARRSYWVEDPDRAR